MLRQSRAEDLRPAAGLAPRHLGRLVADHGQLLGRREPVGRDVFDARVGGKAIHRQTDPPAPKIGANLLAALPETREDITTVETEMILECKRVIDGLADRKSALSAQRVTHRAALVVLVRHVHQIQSKGRKNTSNRMG